MTRKRQHIIPLMALACLVALSGCAQFRIWALEMRYHEQLNRANREFDRQVDPDYLYAASLYESLIDRYPRQSEQRASLLLRQGISLYHGNEYHGARRVFLQLINEHPGTLQAGDARVYVGRIDGHMSPEASRRVEALEEARDDLARLEIMRRDYPFDDRVHRAIGDIYWDMGQYDEAMRHYTRAMELDAASTEVLLRRNRLRVVDEQGTMEPIRPQQRIELQRETEPIQVFNLYEYYQRSGTDLSRAVYDKYTLTGMVRNQSSRILGNVRLRATFYNAQYYVLGQAEQMIGTMGPGEVRSFVVTTDTADNLYNIAHYDYDVVWEEM